MTLTPKYAAPSQPLHPCRQIHTRHCPAVYDAECGDRPCARFESDDETPWLAELDRPLGSVTYVQARP